MSSPTESGFEVVNKIPRLQLDEDHWAAVFAQTEVATDDAGALAPMADAGSKVPEPDVVSSAELALGRAPVRLEVTTVAADRGVVASLGCDGGVAAGAARVLAIFPDDQPTVPVPGIELSLARTQHLVGEVLRLFPPDVPLADVVPADPVTVPHEQALVLASAVQADDEALLAEIAAQQGWDELPEVLRSLATDVRGNATVSIRVQGSDNVVVCRWLLSDRGWVGVTVTDEHVVHTPCDRQQIAGQLTYHLAGAFDVVLTEAGHDG